MTVSQIHRSAGNPNSDQGGFTIIELMVAVAIVSILAVIAMPAYQNYTIRSKVSEGITFVGEAKTSVTARYYSTNVMPTNNVQAGLDTPESYDDLNFVKRLEISSIPVDGTIIVTFKLPRSSANDKQLQLVPSTTTGQVVWTCEPVAGPTGISGSHAPANCRG